MLYPWNTSWKISVIEKQETTNQLLLQTKHFKGRGMLQQKCEYKHHKDNSQTCF